MRQRTGFLDGTPTTPAVILLLAAILVPFAASVYAGPTDVVLTWNANPEPDVTGYQIAYGSSPGSHPNVLNAGNVTTYTVTGLTTGATYYFVIQAQDGAGNLSPNSQEVSGVAGAAPALALALSETPDPVQAGSNITYTLSYSNTGTAGATGVVITDTLPASTSFVSATGGGTRSGSVVTWNLGSLAAAASGSVQLVVQVVSPLADGTVITNNAAAIDSAQTNPVTATAAATTVSSAPLLAISKTDAADPVQAGSNITYTLSYSNTGNMNASGVAVSDTLPANTTFVSATAGGTASGSVVTWNVGALNAGASGSAQLVVRTTSPLPNGTLITNGTYSIDSAQTSPVSGSPVTTTVSSIPVLTISKTDSPDPVQAGGNITYTLSYANTGSMDASGVVVSDTVPANTAFVSATSGGSLVAGVVTWNVGALPVGATGSAQLVVQVASPLATGTVITNGAYSIDSAETSPVSGAAVTTTVNSAPTLSVSASDSPDPVQAGGNITYTLSYANSGNASGTSVILSDTLPANTSFVSATGGGTLSGAVVTWSLGTVAPGGGGSVQLVARVASPLANGTTITNATYSIDSAQTSPVAGTAVTTGVSSAPILALTQNDAPDPVNAGSNLTYTLAYSNSGNANATGLAVSAPLPANTTYVSSTPAASVASGTATWSLGTLLAGASGSVSLTVRVTSPLANGTVITASGASVDCAETAAVTAAAITTTVGSAPALALTVTDAPDPVAAGANLTYTLGYTNNGNANATSVVLTAAVPVNTTFVSATGGGTASSGTVTWNLGTVNAGVSGSVQLVARVNSPLANGTTISSGASSLDCAETAAVNGPSVTTVVTSAPVFSLSKTDNPNPVAAGATLTYTLSYANNGNANATGVILTDTVPASTTFVSAGNGGVLSGSTITWNLGTLAAGASGSTQVVVRVVSPLTNGTNLVAGAYSIDCAETGPTSGASISTTVVSSPALSVLASDAPDPVGAGALLTYTLTYANGGNAVALNTLLSATLPANTTFVSATGGGTLSGGVVNWGLGTMNVNVFGSVQLVTRVATPLPNGTTITLQTYSIDSNQTTPDAGSPITTTVTSNPLLSLTLSDAPDPVLAGGNLTYTVAFGNTGNGPATGVAIAAAVPAGTTFVSATGGGGASGSLVTWNLGALNAGGTGSVQMIVGVAATATSGSIITAAGWTIDSNETATVTAAAAYTSVTEPSAPTITSAVETVTNSVYIVRGTTQTVRLTGTAFLDGAVLNLSPDISAGATTVNGSTALTAGLSINSGASLGARTVTLTNPDGRMGSLANALRVVKKSDVNGDCRADGIDLNALARSWNSDTSEPGYNAVVDFDGDGYVGPDDLTVFIEQFGKHQPGCP